MNFFLPSLHPDPDVQHLMFPEKVFSLSCLGSVNFSNCLEGEMEKFSTCLLWDIGMCYSKVYYMLSQGCLLEFLHLLVLISKLLGKEYCWFYTQGS